MRRRQSLSPHRGGETTLSLPSADAPPPVAATVFDAIRGLDSDVSKLVACNESLIASAPPSRNVSVDAVVPGPALNPTWRSSGRQVQPPQVAAIAGRHWESLSSMSISDATVTTGAQPRPLPKPFGLVPSSDPSPTTRPEVKKRQPAVSIVPALPEPTVKGGPTAYELALDECCNDLLESVKKLHEGQELKRLQCVEQRRKLARMYRVPYEPPCSEPRPKRPRRPRSVEVTKTMVVASSHDRKVKRARSSSAGKSNVCSDTQGHPHEVTPAATEKKTSKANSTESVHQNNAAVVTSVMSNTPPPFVLGVAAATSVPPTHGGSRSSSQRSSTSERPLPLPLKRSLSPMFQPIDEKVRVSSSSSARELLMFLRPRAAPRPWRGIEELMSGNLHCPAAPAEGNDTPLTGSSAGNRKPVPVYKSFVPTIVLHEFHRKAVLRGCWVKMTSVYRDKVADVFRRRWALKAALSFWRERSSDSAEQICKARAFLLRSKWKKVVKAVDIVRASRAFTANVRSRVKRRVFFSWLQSFHTSQLTCLVARRREISCCDYVFRRWQTLARLLQSNRRRLVSFCWAKWVTSLGKSRHSKHISDGRTARSEGVVTALARHTLLVLLSRFWSLWRKFHRATRFSNQLETVAKKSHALKLLHRSWRKWTGRWIAAERAKRNIVR